MTGCEENQRCGTEEKAEFLLPPIYGDKLNVDVFARVRISARKEVTLRHGFPTRCGVPNGLSFTFTAYVFGPIWFAACHLSDIVKQDGQ